MQGESRSFPERNYAFVRAVISAAFGALTRVHIAGRENVPVRGPLLLVTNHLSRLDPPLICVAVPRPIRIFIGLKFWFHSYWFSIGIQFSSFSSGIILIYS